MSLGSAKKDVWSYLESSRSQVKGWSRAVDHVRKTHVDADPGGRVVSELSGHLLEKTIDMLVAEAELFLAREQLAISVRRTKLASDLFWQEALESEGLDPEGSYSVDLSYMCIRLSHDEQGSVDSESYRSSLDQWANLVEEALKSPLAALRMAKDPTLPRWLGQFAQALSNTNAEDPKDFLVPTLRRLVETWLEHPAEARAFKSSKASSEAPNFLQPLAGLLGQRQRW